MCDDNRTVIERMINHEFEDSDDVADCPFCGETSEDGLILLETDDHQTWFIRCDNCMCDGPSAVDRDGAIELWTSRFGESSGRQVRRKK